jgi:hypothetical protein
MHPNNWWLTYWSISALFFFFCLFCIGMQEQPKKRFGGDVIVGVVLSVFWPVYMPIVAGIVWRLSRKLALTPEPSRE